MALDSKELLAAKVSDCIKTAERRPCFLGFLDETQAAFCEDILKREKGVQYLFWGGFPEAERKMLGLFPDYLEPTEELFPLTPLTFSYREADKLSHRDFLGSFMALGIEREVVGDILVESGKCVAFIKKEMTPHFLNNIKKIGRVGVKITEGVLSPVSANHEFLEISGVIASQRLDCFIALLCKTGREKAAGLIESGMVMRNHREVLSVSERMEEGDTLSVRGYGKFIIDKLGPLTSKGRLSVKCRKYK